MPETAKYWSKSARQCCRSADSFSSTQSSLLSAVVAVDHTLSTAAAAETDQDCFHSGRPQLFVGGVCAPLGVAQSWQLLLAVGDCRHHCWLEQRVFPWRVALAEQIGRSLRGRTGIWPSRERLIGESRPGEQLGWLEELLMRRELDAGGGLILIREDIRHLAWRAHCFCRTRPLRRDMKSPMLSESSSTSHG